MALLWLVACVAPVLEVPTSMSVAELWAAELESGVVTVGPVVVTSPRTLDGSAFWVQDPGGGPGTGLRVSVTGFQEGVPPAMGTAIGVTGSSSRDLAGVPRLDIDDDAAVSVFGEDAVTVTPWTGALTDVGSPVALGLVGVTSAVDPLGDADVTGGIRIRGVFGTFPGGWDEAAVVAGIALTETEVAPRTAADWAATRAPRPPRVVQISEVASMLEGTPVVLDGVVESAPWSEDGRWTAVQSEDGGLWIDAEGWGLAQPRVGDVVHWEGEVRRGADGTRLRTWTDPVVSGSAPVGEGGELVEGARVSLDVTGVGEPDAWGARPTEQGVPIDDRFLPLDAFPLACRATGIVRLGPSGDVQLAAFAWQ